MSRQVHQREDLLREAVALVPRIQLALADGTTLFAGFRGDAVSLYFNDDPVYHFNGRNQLRRAYVAERILKAERGAIVQMVRRESAEATTLVSRELDAAETAQVVNDLALRCAALDANLKAEQFSVIGQVPEGGDAVARIRHWLDAFFQSEEITVAGSPRHSS